MQLKTIYNIRICIIIDHLCTQKFVNSYISGLIDSKQPGRVVNAVSMILIFLSVCSSLSLHAEFTYQFFMASNRCLHSFKTAIHLTNCQQRLACMRATLYDIKIKMVMKVKLTQKNTCMH